MVKEKTWNENMYSFQVTCKLEDRLVIQMGFYSLIRSVPVNDMLFNKAMWNAKENGDTYTVRNCLPEKVILR